MRADEFLDGFFEDKLREATKIGDSGNGLINVPKEMMAFYREYMRGGKKLRGALVQLGYEVGGGKKSQVLSVSAAIEIIHAFILMQDDVMDKDDLRRGQLAIHKQWQQMCEDKLKAHSDSVHFGESLAYATGDVGTFLGMGLIVESKLPAKRKLEALSYLNGYLSRIGYGQGLDLTYELSDHVTEADVMRVHLHKTAHYTISGPLKLGGILAGLGDKQLEAMEKYGEAIGIAFQLKDDELGLFSDDKTLGKTVGSDIKEDKSTILKIKALELTSQEDKTFLQKTYGNKNLKETDLKRVQEITKNCGALAYSQELTQTLIDKGKKYIPQITDIPEHQDTLTQLADFITRRNN